MDEIIYIEETASTNNMLKELYHANNNLAEFTMVSAGYQTAGRGQQGNVWVSEKNKNIMCSILLKPTFLHARNQFALSEAVALSVATYLDSFCDGAKVKWPNDIYYRDKKICGILIENILQSHCISASIVGIGINVNQTTFPPDAPNPVSLSQLTGQEHDLANLTKGLRQSLIMHYNLLAFPIEMERMHEKYMMKLCNFGQQARYADASGTFDGKIVDIERPEGKLVIEDSCGKIRKYGFKEVTLLG